MPDTTLHWLYPLVEQLASSAANPRSFAVVPLHRLHFQYLLATCTRQRRPSKPSGTVCVTHIDVSPTAGAMQLNRMVGAYSNAIVLVAT